MMWTIQYQWFPMLGASRLLRLIGLGVLLSGCGDDSSNGPPPPIDSTAPPVVFEDATSSLSGFTYGPTDDSGDQVSGVAWFDYNNDTWLDFYVANGKGGNDGLMRNNGDGTFTNVVAQAGFGDENGSSGVVAADLDNDGDDDLIVTGDTAAFAASGSPSDLTIRIFDNQGDETFANVTASSGVAVGAGPGVAWHPVLGDVDRDGLLDLFVTAPSALARVGEPLHSNHLFLNKGGLQFEDISAASGVGYAGASCVAAFSHFDEDSMIDLYVGDCNGAETIGGSLRFKPGAFRLFRNNGDLTFTELDVGLPHPPPDAIAPTNELGFWMSTAIGDYDNDGDFDLFATNVGNVGSPDGAPAQQPHAFFERTSEGQFGSFVSVEVEAGISAVAREFSWGASFADFNNDTREDLVFAGNATFIPTLRNPGYLMVNRGDKTFRSESLPVSFVNRLSSGLAVADYNNDGFVDVLVGLGGFAMDPNPTPVLLRNAGGETSWVALRLVGTTSNRSAVGSIVRIEHRGVRMTKEIRAGSSFLSQDSLWLTFGLGPSDADEVTVSVQWPTGVVEEFPNVPVRQISTLTENDS